jgi:hypothetical protein
MMRKAFIVIALLAAFIVAADAASSYKKTGTIISVNADAKTFVCQWNKVNYTYKVTDKTNYRIQGKNSDFSAIKIGEIVNIGYHYAGKQRVADWVTIEKR